MKTMMTALLAALLLAAAARPAEAGRVVVRRHRVVARPAKPAVVVAPSRRIVVRPSAVVAASVAGATIDVDVDPEESRVFVDGRYRGTADDLDGFPGVLHLAAGTHDVRIETPDGKSVSRKVTLGAGAHVTVDLELS